VFQILRRCLLGGAGDELFGIGRRVTDEGDVAAERGEGGFVEAFVLGEEGLLVVRLRDERHVLNIGIVAPPR
jgi:hypothetical protein